MIGVFESVVGDWGEVFISVAVIVSVLGAYLVVFCGLLVLVSRPFDRLDVPALDGGGLNPVLLHPAMLYHPPVLYLGLTALAAPWATTIAAGASAQVSRSSMPLNSSMSCSSSR